MDSYQPSESRRRRDRSRSPRDRSKQEDVKRHRSRSPYREHKHRHHHRHHDKDKNQAKPAAAKKRLPFKRQQLKKEDFEEYEPLFAEYLDLQKGLQLETLEEREVKGRWKSFLRKWNEGELSEGWYEPGLQERAKERWKVGAKEREARVRQQASLRETEDSKDVEEDDEDDGYGPALPGKGRSGPAIPTLDDLQHRRELADDESSARREDLRYERKADAQLQKSRLEELAPRADPGSRERQMEKKQAFTAVNREFKDAKDGGDVEVGDKDLMGDDGVEGYKKEIKEFEKKKNEREVRKEEVLRARAQEREERLAGARRKEEETMGVLKRLARERFG